MSIEITPLGGIGEVGKNMTLVSIGEEKIIVDMGIKLEKLLNLGNKNISEAEREKLIKIGGIPDDSKLRSEEVSAIILTHGHLDHIGAVGKLAHEYDATIYATPFTAELVKRVIKEERKFEVDNEIETIEPGEDTTIEDLEINFIPGAHSIPQNSFPAIKSSEGVVLCIGGFKIDKNPVLGDSTDYQALKNLTNDGKVVSLICSVKADEPEPTPSESHAKEMLKEIMTKASNKGGGILITAFSSHIARIKEITEIAQELNRTPVILGKSLKNKCKTAKKLKLVDFPSETKIFGHITSIREALEVINESREDYVIITTGHQGEPNSILSRIADKVEPYKIEEDDDIIFSASVIPKPLNISNRDLLEAKLVAQGAKIHQDVHVSGHAGQPGTMDLLEEVSPDHIIPFHGTVDKVKSVINLGRKIGFSEKQLHLLRNEETFSMGD